MVKKALVLNKLLEIKKRENWKTVDDFFNNSQKIYQEVKDDSENLIGNCDYNTFLHQMQQGFAKAQFEQQVGAQFHHFM